jgi:hypothetical protein
MVSKVVVPNRAMVMPCAVMAVLGIKGLHEKIKI